MLFTAAAGPRFVFTELAWLNRGADIIFVLDISPSMAALDMDGASRFAAARGLLKNFAERRPTDGIGLVAVGSDAALLLPPTMDRKLLASRLEELRIGELGDGTATLAIFAARLFRSAVARYLNKAPRCNKPVSRCLVLYLNDWPFAAYFYTAV